MTHLPCLWPGCRNGAMYVATGGERSVHLCGWHRSLDPHPEHYVCRVRVGDRVYASFGVGAYRVSVRGSIVDKVCEVGFHVPDVGIWFGWHELERVVFSRHD